MTTNQPRLTKSISIPGVDAQVSYQIRQSIYLSLVPALCGMLLMLLVFVFSKLNLYYLEANGLILESQVRDAYYLQVQLEILGVIGFLVLQMIVTSAVSFVIMRWATAPFANAFRMIENAVDSPAELKPMSRWLSESPRFDRTVWSFAQRIRGGEAPTVKGKEYSVPFNFRFLLKFLLATAALSVITGAMMSIIFGVIYRHIVDLALQLIQNTKSMPHYFMAQEEILGDAALLLSIISFLVFACIGIQISRYMANMLFVFGRAIQEDKFPITLRSDDIYHDLGHLLNRAREKIT